MDLKGPIAVVTGADRGIGRAFARALLEHGRPAASTVPAHVTGTPFRRPR
ncbi:hypothetical protein ABGB18_01765 [Nonomuraea sp. B12E4]